MKTNEQIDVAPQIDPIKAKTFLIFVVDLSNYTLLFSGCGVKNVTKVEERRKVIWTQ